MSALGRRLTLTSSHTLHRTALMRRFRPVLLIILGVAILVGGLVWKIAAADECLDQGGGVTAPMTRSQDCVTQ
jgi:sulfite exporter TauE/SafE